MTTHEEVTERCWDCGVELEGLETAYANCPVCKADLFGPPDPDEDRDEYDEEWGL